MHRILAVGLTGLLLMAGALPADDKTEKKTEKKAAKDKAKKESKSPPKDAQTFTIVSVDAKEHSIKVKDADGKTSTLNIGKDAAILGPQGGKSEGFKDDRLAAGAKIKVEMDGKDVKTVWLPVRESTKDKAKAVKDKIEKKKTEKDKDKKEKDKAKPKPSDDK